MLLPIRLIVIVGVGVGVSLIIGSATAVGPSRQDRHYENLQVSLKAFTPPPRSVTHD